MDQEDEIPETFTADQRSRLAAALGLNSKEEIDGAISAIVATIHCHHLYIAARKRTPDRVKTKYKLKQIAGAARKLKALLSDFDVSHSIGNQIEEAEILSHQVSKLFHRHPLWSDDEISVLNMLELLQNIDNNAMFMVNNDRSLSHYYMVLTTQKVNREFNAEILWPRLFKFWEMAGNKVASTPDGPTFRFLVLIHEVARIDAPKPDSLRSACKRWRTDPMRERPEEIPWVA